MATIYINSLNDIQNAARNIIKRFGKNKIIAFKGKMGAGKTTLIKAICKELSSEDIITSPTFSLVNEYNRHNGEKIYHFDFYRINSIEELYDFGYEEYIYSDNYCFIEWPEKIENHIPDNTTFIEITAISDSKRIVTIK